MTTTVNMDLDLPVVGETLGPEWAEQLNDALEVVDAHSHVTGEGVPVPTAGLNINADLPINGFAITDANALTLQPVDGTPEDLSIYSSGGNLLYRNAAGNPVLITNGDAIAGSVGAIAGLGDGDSSAVFSDLSEDFSWFFDGVAGKVAAFNIGDIRLFPFNGSTLYTNFITLKSPTALASNYSLTLPTALPANTNFVQVSSTGTLSFTNTLTQPVLAAAGSVGSPSYTFSTDTDTGMYSHGTNELGFAAGGARSLVLSTTAVAALVPFRAPNGSAVTPSIAFDNDTDTGIYRSGADSMAFAARGVARVGLTTALFDTNLPFTTTGTLTGASIVGTSLNVSSGAITGGSINLGGGGAYKTYLYSTTTTSSGEFSFSVPGASQIIGVIGFFRTVENTGGDYTGYYGAMDYGVSESFSSSVPYFVPKGPSIFPNSSISYVPATTVYFNLPSGSGPPVLSRQINITVFYT